MAMRQSEMMSLRMPASVAKRLRQTARRSGQSRSSLIHRYVDEGLKQDRHPLILFKDGPTGRRAAVVAGPDVWEIVSFVDDLEATGDAAIRDAAEALSLPVGHVRAAMAYAAEFPDEVRERIELNREAAEEAEAAWDAQQDLLS